MNLEVEKLIPNLMIKIFEKDVGRENILAAGKTNENGIFNIELQARTTDLLDNIVELFAEFEGNEDYRQSKSDMFLIEVI